MWQKSWKVLLAVVITVVLIGLLVSWLRFDKQAHVEEFVAAFNNKDVETMMEYVADDIEWLYITDNGVEAETQGKEALQESMTKYLTSCMNCRSELSDMIESERRVSVVETAHWLTANGDERSQQSLSVYEFNDDEVITRVYYFPSERID